ncbi:hypothetical protein QNO07_06260 [Streptomyces sp. 549]|uniref:hypothetical protein n=1 Tax=Streptomyces sp. 549 TaxID=3049076 RepID=UPI0024C3F4F9|nr:hypothetical protein [Streptomyces sp. 549]MDK1473028.1 hypothetical protein [Streptomyces sp. 549]
MAPTPALSVPYAAYLRVYEPLAAFPEPERSHWVGYARRADLPDAQDELRRSLAALLAVPPLPVPVRESADAFVSEVDGVLCVCPWRTRLRGWLALAEAGEELPPPVRDAALPPVVRREALADFDEWRSRAPHHADARPWIRSALWHVPVRWFLMFDDAEREYGKARDGLALRYRTPMVQARRRLARALKLFRAELGEGALVDGLIDVGRWLEDFHPRSMVELDYGGLVYTIPEEQLAADRSAADAAAGVAALRDGDADRADELFDVLTERWRAVRERLYAN